MKNDRIADLYLAGRCTDALRQAGADRRWTVEQTAGELRRVRDELGAAVCAALGASPEDVQLRCDPTYRESRRRERVAEARRQEQFWEQYGPRDE